MLFSPSTQRRRLQLQISERRLVLMAGDVLAVLFSVTIALFVWSVVARTAFDFEFIFPRSHWYFILTGIWLLLASANDFYELRVAASKRATYRHLILITLQMVVLYLIVFFFAQPLALPRLFILYYAVASFLLIAVFRLLNPALAGWISTRRRVLIVGTDWAAMTMIGAIGRHAHDVYDIRGVIAELDDTLTDICDVPVVGRGKDIARLVFTEQISELIVTSTREMSKDIFQGVMDAYEQGATIVPMPLLYERITGQVPVEHVINNWAVVLPIDGGSIFNPYQTLKRILDILISLVGALAFLVLLPFIVLAIKLDSPGSIFYSQERMGLNGHTFRIYKFRSMRADAEAKTGAVFSRQGDDRVTRVGRFMRKTRLDELPQILNILRGDMSIVGPRPERPEHVKRLTEKIPFYRTRLVIRPGLTGWAQVRYNYGSTDEDALMKLQYDLYYIRHQSILLDLNIILRTVGKVIKMSGV
ncbi:MAG: sugar transferase [Chloroflexi bacterium]|nr:sugar transferase [Chloroflexota bacterium]MCC6896995.1 sugar transferase [Anaerolineae bacterium]